MQTSAKMRVKTINKQLALCRNELRGLCKLGVQYRGSEYTDSDDSFGSNGDEDSDDGGGTGSDSDTEKGLYYWQYKEISLETLKECISMKYLIQDDTSSYHIKQHKDLVKYIKFLVQELHIPPDALAEMENDHSVAAKKLIRLKEYGY